MSCSVTTWESWTGAALRTGTRVSSEQTDEEDQEAGEWHNLQTAHLRTGNHWILLCGPKI